MSTTSGIDDDVIGVGEHPLAITVTSLPLRHMVMAGNILTTDRTLPLCPFTVVEPDVNRVLGHAWFYVFNKPRFGKAEQLGIQAGVFHRHSSHVYAYASKHPPAEPGAFGIAAPSRGAYRNPKSKTHSLQTLYVLKLLQITSFNTSGNVKLLLSPPAEPGD
jgi:hypothetical protein